jgi:AcrR family transcriptional regulator
MQDSPGPGRPRSEAARRAILSTALRVARRDGYDSLTMDRIAAEAGVGKQTIYRWWRSKAEVTLDALRELAEEQIESADTGRLAGDVEALLSQTFATSGTHPGLDRVLCALMGEAQRDPAFATLFREQLIEPRRQVLEAVLERAQQRGDLPRSADLGLLLDVVFGTMWYRMLTGIGRVDDGLARDLGQLVGREAARGQEASEARPARSRRASARDSRRSSRT